MKKVNSCDSKSSNLSILCSMFIASFVFFNLVIMFIMYNSFTQIETNVENGMNLYIILYFLFIVATPVFIMYKMCRHKCRWLYFACVLLLIYCYQFVVEKILLAFHQNLYIIASLQSKYPSINSVKFYKDNEMKHAL